MEPAPESVAQVARRAWAAVEARLPPGWTLTLNEDRERNSATRTTGKPDYVATLASPDGASIALVAAVKRIVERRDIANIAAMLNTWIASLNNTRARPVVMARYLSPAVRAELMERNIDYADATGNLRITSDAPAIFLSDRGSDSDPWRGIGRPRGTLKGEPAARVVRALLDVDQDWRVTELVQASGASVGATYRVLDYLEQESLVERTAQGRYAVTDWLRLLRSWSADYDVLKEYTVRQYFDPRGADALLERMAADAEVQYAITGTLAARQWAPYAPAAAALVYVTDTDAAADRWQLRATTTTANVLLLEPHKPKSPVFSRTWKGDGALIYAAPSQVAVDLMSGPGRNPAEAEELIRWMSESPARWRR